MTDPTNPAYPSHALVTRAVTMAIEAAFQQAEMRTSRRAHVKGDMEDAAETIADDIRALSIPDLVAAVLAEQTHAHSLERSEE